MPDIAVIGVPGGWSTELLADTVAERTGKRHLVDPAHLVLDLDAGTVRDDHIDLAAMDAIIVKKVGPRYSPMLLDRLEMLRYVRQRHGVRIFSDPMRIMGMIDRMSCTVTLRAGNIPMPPTVLTERVDQAVRYVHAWGRAIFKPLYTSKARGMIVVDAAKDDVEARVRDFQDEGNDVIYLQRMISHKPGEFKDLGVTFMGGAYVATYARLGNGDSWNTTTHSGGRYEAYEPSQEIIALAHRAQALFGLDFTCVDVVETPEGPQVFEVSAFGGFRGLLEANSLNAAELYADYVLRHIG
ncbi:MAG: GAK system ATP-grasp enzyme [Desulfovibrionaceae bacterium]